MADYEVLYHIGKIEEEIRHGKLGMISQYSMGYHFFAFFKMADGKTKAHVAAKTIFSQYYFKMTSSILNTIANKKVVNW